MTICWTQRILLIIRINNVKLDEANSLSMRTSTLGLPLAVVFLKTKRLNRDLGGGLHDFRIFFFD